MSQKELWWGQQAATHKSPSDREPIFGSPPLIPQTEVRAHPSVMKYIPCAMVVEGILVFMEFEDLSWSQSSVIGDVTIS
jgi:hypothetical protein